MVEEEGAYDDVKEAGAERLDDFVQGLTLDGMIDQMQSRLAQVWTSWRVWHVVRDLMFSKALVVNEETLTKLNITRKCTFKLKSNSSALIQKKANSSGERRALVVYKHVSPPLALLEKLVPTRERVWVRPRW